MLYIYSYILLLLYFINKNKFCLNYIFILILFLIKNVTYVDMFLFFLILNVINVFKKNINNFNKCIHISLLVILYFTWHQLYIFNFENNNIVYLNIILIKLNYTYIINYIYIYDFYQNIFFNIKLYLLFVMEIKNNLGIFINNPFKGVFEKLIMLHNCLHEIYNYNLQQLNQPNSVFIFLAFIFLAFIYLFFLKFSYNLIHI